jgi:integrase
MTKIEERPLRRGGVDVGMRYVVRVRRPDPQPGQGLFTSATFATKPEAIRFNKDIEDGGVAFALAEYERNGREANEPTLDEWAKTHFDALTKAGPGTVARYRKIYDARWSPRLGRKRLSTITRTDVATALNAQDGSDKTLKNAWAVLTHMLKLAAQDGLIPKSPTIGVGLPRRTEHEKVEHRYLTVAEYQAVLDATPEFWRPLVVMLAASGMRWGEAVALNVGDLDLVTNSVRITKAERRDDSAPGGVSIGPPKSRKARRTVILPPEALPWLEPLARNMNDTPRRRDARLFTASRGGEVRHRTFYRLVWQKAIRESGIAEPLPRLHDLRHSHVAWLIAQGVSLPVIQARLGHEKITTTIDTYGHLLPDVMQAAADAASVVFRTIRPVQAPELGPGHDAT